mgnify:CR=1
MQPFAGAAHRTAAHKASRTTQGKSQGERPQLQGHVGAHAAEEEVEEEPIPPALGGSRREGSRGSTQTIVRFPETQQYLC